MAENMAKDKMWKNVKNNLLGDNVSYMAFSSQNVTVSKFETDCSIELPTHSHPYEQISIVVEGEMLITIGNRSIKMSKDDVCMIPANIEHSAKFTKTPFKSFDVFYPIREDFLEN